MKINEFKFNPIVRLIAIASVALLVGVIAPAGAVVHKYVITSKTQISPQVRKDLRGTAGAPGKSGAAGATGVAGAVGPVGASGANGAQGDRGLQGAIGPIGPVGPVGPKGDTGAPGKDGTAASKGDKGDPGAKGDTGATGPTGPAGPAGAQGPKGDSGAKGATGATGSIGPQGPQGPAGNIGSIVKRISQAPIDAGSPAGAYANDAVCNEGEQAVSGGGTVSGGDQPLYLQETRLIGTDTWSITYWVPETLSQTRTIVAFVLCAPTP